MRNLPSYTLTLTLILSNMKKLLFILSIFVLVLLFAARCAPGHGEGILFMEDNWAAVVNKAKTEHKPIFLDISASWCGPCKMLKRQTFTDNKVAAYFNANFVNASFDGEVGDGAMLANKFRVEAYPSLYIVDTNGRIISASAGYMSAKELLKFGKNVFNGQ